MFVGKNISYLRKTMNLTQDELAQKIIVSRQTISKWENGEVVPDSLNLIELSKLFNVKVDDLLMNDIESVRLNEISISDEVEKLDSKPKNKSLLTLLIVSLLFIFIIAIYMNRENLFPTKENNIEQEVIIDEIEEVVNIDYSKLLSAGREFSVYIDQNGKVVGVGDNTYKQLNFENWSDIVQISAGGFHTLGLKSDGTVVATGYNNFKQIDVGSWSNIKQVSGGRYHSLGLKEDGTVLCVGENQYGACNVSSWTDIIQVSAGRYNSYGLKSDGTVVSTENNEYGQADISSWADITQVSAGTYHVIGLKNDGSVVCVGGQKGDGVCNVSSWSDIKQVVGAGYHSIGLKNDGTVVAVGNNDKGQLDLSGWKDVVAVSGGRYHTIGLTKDNQFLSLGLYENENIITGEEGNDPDDSKTNEKGTFKYRMIGSSGYVSYLISDSGNSISNLKYLEDEYRIEFKSKAKQFLLKFTTIDGIGYTSDIYNSSKESDLVIEDIHEELLKVLRVDQNTHKDQILKISISEMIDESDISKGYTNWKDLSYKYVAKDDFAQLFARHGQIELAKYGNMTSLYPGRLDISKYKSGADLDLSFGYDYTNLLFSSQTSSYDGSANLNIQAVLSNDNKATWSSKIPDDFRLGEIYYLCNSVYSVDETGIIVDTIHNLRMISNCSPFTLNTAQFGVTDVSVSPQYGEINFRYALNWMNSKADSNFDIEILAKDIKYVNAFEKSLKITDKRFIINVIDEMKKDIIVDDNTPDVFTVNISITAKGVGNYLKSLPFETYITLKKSDFID